MSNVINLNRENDIPNDLMSIRALCLKHGFKYGYLYKWSCLEDKITVYPRGGIKLSEKDVLEFEQKRGVEKYGRNKQKTMEA